jgi:hypothetical protein
LPSLINNGLELKLAGVSSCGIGERVTEMLSPAIQNLDIPATIEFLQVVSKILSNFIMFMLKL